MFGFQALRLSFLNFIFKSPLMSLLWALSGYIFCLSIFSINPIHSLKLQPFLWFYQTTGAVYVYATCHIILQELVHNLFSWFSWFYKHCLMVSLLYEILVESILKIGKYLMSYARWILFPLLVMLIPFVGETPIEERLWYWRWHSCCFFFGETQGKVAPF